MFFNLRSCLLLLLPLLLLPRPAAAIQGDTAQYKLGLIIGNEKSSRLDGDILTVTTDAFVASRRFVMAERTQLDAVFSELDLQSFLEQGSADLSRILGLDMLGIVEYTIEKSRNPQGGRFDAFYIQVRLIDVETGSILTVLTSDRDDILLAPSTPRKAAELLFHNIRAAYPPVGYVIKIEAGELVVDLGSEVGVQEGDLLEVVREGEQIIHPVTGKPMPAEQIPIGELKVTATTAQMSTCKLKSENAPIELGDRVRLVGRDSKWRQMTGKVLKIFGG